VKQNNPVTTGVITLCLFLGYDARIASAQVLYGSIVGTVTDQANAVVPRSVVSVQNTSTGLSRQVNTDDDGYYSITNLPEGTVKSRLHRARMALKEHLAKHLG